MNYLLKIFSTFLILTIFSSVCLSLDSTPNTNSAIFTAGFKNEMAEWGQKEFGLENTIKQFNQEKASTKCGAISRFVELKADQFIPDIAQLLSSADPRVKACALRGLAGFSADEYSETMARYLNDNDGEVRAASVEALGKLGRKEYIPQIAAMLKDVDVRNTAMWALAELDAKEYSDSIAKFLNEGTGSRGMAMQALGRLGARKYKKDIAALMKDPSVSAYELQAALESLRRLKATEFTADIAGRINESPPEVILALMEFNAREYADHIVDWFKTLKSQNDYVQIEYADVVAQALVRFEARHQLPFLAELLRKSIEQDNTYTAFKQAREGAVDALVKLGGKVKYGAVLLNFINDSDPDIRSFGIYALGKNQSFDAKEQLLSLLEDKDPLIRLSSVLALWELDPSHTAENFKKIVNDEAGIEWDRWPSWLYEAVGGNTKLKLGEYVQRIIQGPP